VFSTVEGSYPTYKTAEKQSAREERVIMSSVEMKREGSLFILLGEG
jgi:hypothetical protein